MAVNTQNINVKSVAKYMLLPGIIPRAKAMGSGGFGYLAFLFACVYRSVRILPPTHPYVNPDNIGKFGLIQVISAAANNLTFDLKNLDKIFVFAALIFGLVVMTLQFLLLIFALLSGQAFAAAAGGGPFQSMFVTQNPQTDIAFMMLDYVFGLPSAAGGGSFFGSNALAGGPTPFHQGLHALINFYNLAILLVGVLIFLYYVVVVVIETAQTGVPFGRRFAKLYAPFRLIFAVGLLVPLNYGFNGAQYITLYAAKLGSSFATNGWILYNKSLSAGGAGGAGGQSNNPMGVPNTSLLAQARAPGMDEMLYFSSVYHACREIYGTYVDKSTLHPELGGTCIKAYVIVEGKAQVFAETGGGACGGAGGGGNGLDYAAAKKAFGNSDMEIVLGELDADKYKTDPGGVHPYCGRLTVSLNNNNPAMYTQQITGAHQTAGQASGVTLVESAYFNNMKLLLGAGTGSALVAFGERAAHSFVPGGPPNHDTCWKSDILKDQATCKDQAKWSPGAAVFRTEVDSYLTRTEATLTQAYGELSKGLNAAVTDEMMQRGWGGAGIWYNHIADINGTFTSALYATPSVKQYPEVMEFVKSERQAKNKSVTPCGVFDPNLGDDKKVQFRSSKEKEVEDVLNHAYIYFACEKQMQQTGTPANAVPAPSGTTIDTASPACANNVPAAGTATYSNKGSSGNPVIDVMSIVFGVNGLFDIRSSSCVIGTGQAKVHPLAQLSAIGRSLIENAIRTMGASIFAAFGGGIFGILSNSLGNAADIASGMFVTIATIGLVAGFTLYYVLPFLPFIYFFFAVGSWVKSIFEAMVGVPLWALAHLHIDGDGIPGRAALGGYFLIFEIFLRPIVIVFGLIGGMAVFGAMAIMLNNIFDVVVLNSTGAFPGENNATMSGGVVESFRQGTVDKFFYTIMYTILLYMMATSSFKMIDTIPANIMRWINTGVSAFNDNKGDAAANLTSYVAAGGFQVTSQAMQGINQGAKGLGLAAKAAAQATQAPKDPAG